MTAPFRLYGAEFSPFSVKVRAYLRYKGLDFEWLGRTQARAEDVARYAKQPLAPVLVDADEQVLQDSTLTIEALEREYAAPSIVPDDAALQFISSLLEEYADEWLSKAMFHYRWSYPDDAAGAAKRTVDLLFEDAEAPEGVEEAIRTRMIGRLHHVGSSTETAPVIEGSFTRLIGLLEAHFAADRPYLFGGKPSLGDFGLAAQLDQLLSDPTPGAILRAQAPRVVAWIERMRAPRDQGDFATLADVRETLADLLRDEIASAYLAWASANAQAVADDAGGVSIEIAGQTLSQKPQRYAAKGFAALQRKHAATESEGLADLLAATGCAAFFTAAAAAPEESEDEEGDDEE